MEEIDHDQIWFVAVVSSEEVGVRGGGWVRGGGLISVLPCVGMSC